MKTLSLVLISACILVYSCRKDSFITSSGARISLSEDKLEFDTVFTTMGSTTQFFKIINENDQKLRISSVKLMGGASSAYTINVDGTPGPEVRDLEINANDSLYVFVKVNINPNAANLPFIVRDSIEISYNGNIRKVRLEAWGQNAHFLREKEVLTNETWINDLPYVILGYLYVDTNRVLTINKGCRIYVHADAPIVVDGTLLVNGLKDTVDRVMFRGDRIDVPYKDFPAAWPGIFFRESSKDNVLNYAMIMNSYQAIAAIEQPTNSLPKVTLNECVIDNAYDAGIIAINSSIKATNCLVSNCGKNVYLVKGGNYQFTHCTVVTYSNSFILHKDPVLTVSNFLNTATANLSAVFRNCIFWGENGLVDDEVVVVKNGNTTFNVQFDQVLWKVNTTPPNTIITPPAPINNQSPQFDSINTSRNYYDFRLKSSSPAVNKGVNAGVLIDLDGKVRPMGLPDLGAFEQ